MNDALFPYLLFWTVGLLFFAIELIRPARTLQYRSVFLRDLVALGIYDVFFLVGMNITDRIPIPNYASSIMDMPLPVLLILFYVVEDFGLYWVHRVMHTKSVWRVHKWHHSPKYMYWLAGYRTTIPHIIFFNLAYVVALPIVHQVPPWVIVAIGAEHLLRNNWMHMNVAWKSSWLEWVVVTPRYHHIHHSDDPQHYTSNFGSLFTPLMVRWD